MANTRSRKRANLRDVAKLANVSVATVSRVLNTPDSVAEATKAAVTAAIAELRFVPSAAARAINSGRSRVVGALVPTLDHAIFARYLAAIEQTLSGYRLSLVVATTKGDAAIEAEKAQTLVDIGAEGLIVSGVTHEPGLYDLIERCQLPAVATSYYDPDFHLPTIGYDNAGAGRIALQHLLDLGHSRIAVVHGSLIGNDRTLARLKGLEDTGDAELSFVEADLSIEDGCKSAQTILSAAHRPTAILCLSDVLATGVLYEMQRQGVGVPQDVSVIGIDDLPGSAHASPSLTTVHLPVVRMGHATAVAISEWIENGLKPSGMLLATELVARDSTGIRRPA
ncbi:LacI family DNA-binding transcriptional regulator [Roseibium album]|uniref:Purine nucleotide synthesis repressor n=1 Tax=Roseibium album TaxID=311410 RepID=A0A0M6ZID8_9HYPH|nr:LacI family DNA-binding transcriptional regulator [Roseibium album]MBG6161869.1 LacI family transcriptional regulator [Labrenzia sp. EL_195]MBG6199645.1 LacI family transcriptional regulator [Labrenzia sp. EL_13]CTQ62167.1 Purine nucleotide synthesis repressor [Roseibium album]CTQ78620.1 Purine nucleotide synthesis repressor [Roseibium album]CTQ79932.1 Purine nucleotide synthesis repressor [Roseibium album]